MSSDRPQHWLFKEEPSHYSFHQLVSDGRTVWDGITNNLALKNLRSVRKGDLAFLYHSGDERAIVGIVETTSSAYPDPKLGDERFMVVDVKPVRALERPVALNEMKSDPKFATFDLLRLPRLSVMRVSPDIWEGVLALARSRV